MLIHVLCSSTHQKDHTHRPGSCREIVWSKAAVLLLKSGLYQSCLKEFKGLILFLL